MNVKSEMMINSEKTREVRIERKRPYAVCRKGEGISFILYQF